jgi:opacity protein-like surface antigen
MLKRSLITAALLASSAIAAQAADLPTKAPTISSYFNANACQSAGNCSGFYGTFGLGMDAALGSVLTGGVNNGNSLNVGAGYQLWQGQVIAGLEGTVGYQFGTAGDTGTLVSTQFVKLGYNFFPSTATATPAGSQNPFLNLVPANLLANSTPSIIAGGCYGHGVEKGCVGIEVDTVIAATWSAAFQLYNAPSVKGQSDENVFRIMVQKHF